MFLAAVIFFLFLGGVFALAIPVEAALPGRSSSTRSPTIASSRCTA